MRYTHNYMIILITYMAPAIAASPVESGQERPVPSVQRVISACGAALFPCDSGLPYRSAGPVYWQLPAFLSRGTVVPQQTNASSSRR